MYKFSRAQQQNSFRSATPLTYNQIAHYAPSVVATSAHSSRAETYGFIGTGDVLDALGREGFQPYEVRQTLTRKAGNGAEAFIAAHEASFA